MSDDILIGHCSPTLARIKTANMFSVRCDAAELGTALAGWNRELNTKGVHAVCLRSSGDLKLVYVYRKTGLEAVLADDNVRDFLSGIGYRAFDVVSCIARLSMRIYSGESFPHEIGVFLGYPLEDVKGFIANHGKNCTLCGTWKSYTDPVQAKRKFDLFKKCSRIYSELFSSGKKTLYQLTVAG